MLSILCAILTSVQAHPIDGMSPGEWYEVPNSHLRSLVPNPVPPGNPTAIMLAWSGGAFDTKRNRLIVWGGGHGDYGGNELYAFDIASLAWSRPWGPSPSIATDLVWRETNADGNPASRHTYGGLQYLPNVDRFWSAGGSVWSGSGGASPATWTFDFAASQWSRKADFISTIELEQISAVDPANGRVLFANVATSLYEYDPTSNQWSRRSDTSRTLLHDKGAAIDAKRRKLVIVGGGEVLTFDLVAGGALTVTATSGATSIISTRYPGVQYDPVADRIVAWSGGADVYTLDLDTWVWTRRSPAATNTVTPTAAPNQGTYGRFQYIPSRNAYVAVNSIDENVYLYKLSAGGGTTTPPPPDGGGTTPPPTMPPPSSGGGTPPSGGSGSSDRCGCGIVELVPPPLCVVGPAAIGVLLFGKRRSKK